jgi:hypothetical protein
MIRSIPEKMPSICLFGTFPVRSINCRLSTVTSCDTLATELACLGNPDPADMKVYCPEGKETFDDDATTEEAPS